MQRAVLSCAVALPLFAVAQVPHVGTQQRGGTYVEPPAVVDPIYTPRERTGLPGKESTGTGDDQPPLTLQLTLDVPLRTGGTASLGRGLQGSTAVSPTVQAALRWTPWQDTWWFAQLVFHRYLRGDRQQPWHPDFSYAFGYEDFRPGTWSLVYANYTGTRLRPDARAGEGRFNFAQGQWTLSHRFALPARLEPVLLVGDGDAALCSANAHLVPRFTDFRTGGERSAKKSLSLGCRYTRPGGWFGEVALYAWPRRGEQQPWDPDFTYGFGYEHDGPGRVTVKYNNYSGNRFPGRDRGPGEGTVRSGSISLTWSAEW